MNIALSIQSKAMQDFTIQDRTLQFPEDWQECSRDDLSVITELLYGNRLTETDFFLSLGLNLSGIRDKQLFRYYSRLKQMAGYEARHKGHFFQDKLLELKDRFYEIGTKLNWVLEPPSITAPLYPELCKGRYLCVKPGMSDLSYMEYVKAETAFRDYFAVPDLLKQQALDKLMCALYAPKNKKGARQPIPEDDIKAQREMAARMARQPLAVKLAALVFFESCIAALHREFPRIFSGQDESGGNGEGRFGPIGLIIEVAGEKFGNVDQTAEANLYTLLTYLEKEAIKYEEFKARYGK